MNDHVIKFCDGTYYRWSDPYGPDSSTTHIKAAAHFSKEKAQQFVKTFYFGDEFIRIVKVRRFYLVCL